MDKEEFWKQLKTPHERSCVNCDHDQVNHAEYEPHFRICKYALSFQSNVEECEESNKFKDWKWDGYTK